MEIIIKQRINVDDDIADEIRWLNEQGVKTTGSCSGHNKEPPSAIILPSSNDRAVELKYCPKYDESTGLFEMELKGDSFDCQTDVQLDDGRTARCWEAQRQPYENCVFSAGLVNGIEPDTVYLALKREGEQPLTLFLRPDEMQAIAWLCNGTLWAQAMIEKTEG